MDELLAPDSALWDAVQARLEDAMHWVLEYHGCPEPNADGADWAAWFDDISSNPLGVWPGLPSLVKQARDASLANGDVPSAAGLVERWLAEQTPTREELETLRGALVIYGCEG